MPERFAEMLTGGRRNSLGRTSEVVGVVRTDPRRLDELFATAMHADETVRMRAADALEKVCRACPAWLAPHAERVLAELGVIPQASVQWHVAQILDHLAPSLSADQQERAIALLERYLTESSDWIVLNTTIGVLAGWARGRARLAAWLVPELERLRSDDRESVAKRAAKTLAELSSAPMRMRGAIGREDGAC